MVSLNTSLTRRRCYWCSTFVSGNFPQTSLVSSTAAYRTYISQLKPTWLLHHVLFARQDWLVPRFPPKYGRGATLEATSIIVTSHLDFFRVVFGQVGVRCDDHVGSSLRRRKGGLRGRDDRGVGFPDESRRRSRSRCRGDGDDRGVGFPDGGRRGSRGRCRGGGARGAVRAGSAATTNLVQAEVCPRNDDNVRAWEGGEGGEGG